jgi:hypothetical protein
MGMSESCSVTYCLRFTVRSIHFSNDLTSNAAVLSLDLDQNVRSVQAV